LRFRWRAALADRSRLDFWEKCAYWWRRALVASGLTIVIGAMFADGPQYLWLIPLGLTLIAGVLLAWGYHKAFIDYEVATGASKVMAEAKWKDIFPFDEAV
jgi:hypothetical protein